jgi:hypothetical protein
LRDPVGSHGPAGHPGWPQPCGQEATMRMPVLSMSAETLLDTYGLYHMTQLQADPGPEPSRLAPSPATYPSSARSTTEA